MNGPAHDREQCRLLERALVDTFNKTAMARTLSHFRKRGWTRTKGSVAQIPLAIVAHIKTTRHSLLDLLTTFFHHLIHERVTPQTPSLTTHIGPQTGVPPVPTGLGAHPDMQQEKRGRFSPMILTSARICLTQRQRCIAFHIQ